MTQEDWNNARAAHQRGDYATAAALYRALAEEGDARAQDNLGVMYESGLGVPKSYAEALKWYRRAAALGNHDAQNNLGVMYEHGHGVPRDPALALEDRDLEPVLRQAEVAGQEVPAELDRFLLEVVAEREVAEHLEKRVVAHRRSDVVEIVVLAADAHHFLRGRRARVVASLAPKEDVLELVHAGVGEQQRGIVTRNQR